MSNSRSIKDKSEFSLGMDNKVKDEIVEQQSTKEGESLGLIYSTT